MARIRTIKPDFWGSSKTAKVSRDARLLFLGLLNEADDEGRLLGSARSIGGSLFPNDEDFSDDAIRGCLEALEQAGFIRRYVVEGVSYVLVIGFKEHQKISHPTESRLPEPPPRRDRGTPEPLGKDSGAAPEKFAPDLGSGTGNREQGTGKAPELDSNERPKGLALVSDSVSPVATADVPTTGFDEFWQSYPKRNGKREGKPKAVAQWKRLSEHQRRLALAGIGHYADHVNSGGTYAKDAFRWLRDQSWDDWQEPAVPDQQRTNGRDARWTAGVSSFLAGQRQLEAGS